MVSNFPPRDCFILVYSPKLTSVRSDADCPRSYLLLHQEKLVDAKKFSACQLSASSKSCQCIGTLWLFNFALQTSRWVGAQFPLVSYQFSRSRIDQSVIVACFLLLWMFAGDITETCDHKKCLLWVMKRLFQSVNSPVQMFFMAR